MGKMLTTSLEEAIHSIFGSERSVSRKNSVSGGDINEAYCLTLDDGTPVFMKSNAPQCLPNFRAEAEGLEAIRRTGAIGVPKVLGLGRERGFSFMLLEYVSGRKQAEDYWEVFAQELAAMHQADAAAAMCQADAAAAMHQTDTAVAMYQTDTSAKDEDIFCGFGFPHDNWIGATVQKNTKHKTWISFFRDCRLKPQMDAADRYFSAGDRKKAEWLLDHLDRYLVEPPRPSLVHGDLWAGNLITGNDGKGWLIDPAVYYGHPEVDIAMTELFGGFSGRFYECYRVAGRMESGYADRRDLYNLYQLLNHLNMFGSGYLGSVRRIITRYAGL